MYIVWKNDIIDCVKFDTTIVYLSLTYYLLKYFDSLYCDRTSITHVTPRGLTQAVFSNRHSRPYNVSVRSSYLTAGSHTMYRRAYSCRQAASSRNVEFGPLRFPRENRHT